MNTWKLLSKIKWYLEDESKEGLFYVFLKHELLICFAYSTHLALFPNWRVYCEREERKFPWVLFYIFFFVLCCPSSSFRKRENTVSRTTFMKLPLFLGWSLIRLWNSVRQIEWDLSIYKIFLVSFLLEMDHFRHILVNSVTSFNS